MKFYEELNHYIGLLNCTAKDIFKISGLSLTIFYSKFSQISKKGLTIC